MAHKTILLVEDNPDDVALAEAAFVRLTLEHRLIVAGDGEAALACVLHDPDRAGCPPPLPDLVLLDLKLPGVDGFEVLRRMRSHAVAAVLPVIVFTSSVEEHDVLTSYQLGANSYIRKPTDFDEFLAVLEQLVRYWFGLNQSANAEVQP